MPAWRGAGRWVQKGIEEIGCQTFYSSMHLSCPMKRSQEFVFECFRDYYSKVKVPEPDMLQNREFGMILPGRSMWRHLGFDSQDSYRAFLQKNVPLHAYHSSAYYETPNAPTMDKKVWLGADLVFDLDADHIPGHENMNYGEMLAMVKVEFEKLLDDFLLGDFGFDEKDIRIVFSGGRGYHAHVTADSVKALSSHERREIVDYITLPDKDLSQFIGQEVFDVRTFQGHSNVKHLFYLPDENSKGWPGKFRKGVFEYFEIAETKSKEEIIKEFEDFEGIGKKTALDLWKALFEGQKGKRGLDLIRKKDKNGRNRLEAFPSDGLRKRFRDFILDKIRIMAGETDEPVTADVKRLIRLPGSLHGKTGFVVRDISLEELKNFEPLRDALWEGFEGEIEIVGQTDEKIELAGKSWALKEGDKFTVPKAVALFAICKKFGMLAD